ncbi:MAG: trypsin-like peptidase domain-containing protein [Firmicutes bacterium]|nr:trypsin-like peptidase domain-containing protein [Bacillota bacterium]
MKKYPYTDSTEIIKYEPKEKKKNRFKKFIPCIMSAVLASVITAGAVGVGGYYYLKPIKTNETASVAVQQNTASSGMTTLSGINGKKELTVPEIAKKVGPSCVGVINKAKVQPTKYYDPFSGRYFYSSDPNSGKLVEQGSGSGIIISEDGYIATNQHVIADATEINVILNTGKEYKATLVGSDEKSDLAVLKIDESNLSAAELGNSDEVEVGDLAVAIGNPLGQELAGTVTTGVISAVNRKMTVDNRTYNLVQTDAAINPGNSGGALVNKYGQVIGINSIKMSQTGVEGIGFAIAISEAKPIIDDLMKNGYVSGRTLIGIVPRETRNGITVYSVESGSGAEKAGIKEGDLIVKVDGTAVTTVDGLNEIKEKKSPGDYITLTIIRNGELTDVQVQLQEDIPQKKTNK